MQSSLQESLNPLRASFRSGHTRPLSWRLEQLGALKRLLQEGRAELLHAIWRDMRKSPFETMMAEIGPVVGEIDFAIEHLAGWPHPRPAPVPVTVQPGVGKIVHEPMGLVLILGAWNYP